MPYIQKINIKYIDNDTGAIIKLPGLYCEKGLIISHLRYLALHQHKSESWKERSLFSLALLLTYINSVKSFDKVTELLRSFSNALVTGTINFETLNDPLDLYWKARAISDANNILYHITKYTDYLASQDGYESSRVNPFRKASCYEERLNWCAYYQKQANVFLNHLHKKNDVYIENQRVREINGIIAPKVDQEKVIKFPDSEIEKLLQVGFVKKGQQDYKLQAMTILMNYGGLRKSELFHLFVSDITLNPNRENEALVRVYHPEYGRSPDPKFDNRAAYLSSITHYLPRTKYRLTERLYSGWKAPLLTSKSYFFEVIFNPAEKAEEFLKVWINYLKYQRVEPPEGDPHPFAFTNSRGAPETLKNFQRKHKLAIEKIGLECRKELGTTEHGHRHAYGYRCRKAGLSQIEIQRAMHHKSPMSCLVYTCPTSEEIRIELGKTE